jgi:type I restriction enzyme S subunit
MPTPDIIKKYNTSLQPLYNQKLNNLAQSSILVEIRDALLPRLMSGEIEVGDKL